MSRQALYLPSLSGFGEAELAALLLRGMTVKQVFEVLQIGGSLEAFAAMHGLPPAYCERTPADSEPVRTKLSAFLRLDSVASRIDAAIKGERSRFLTYLKQTCGEEAELLTLDIGFHGTIQTAIDSIFRLEDRPLRSIHLLAVGTSGTSRLLARGHDVRCFVGSSGEHADLAAVIARSPAFLEELSMGSFGSTLRYVENEKGLVEPVLAPLALDPGQLRRKEACREGIYAYQLYYDYYCRTKQPVRADRRLWTLPFHRLIDLPTPAEARLLGDLTHQDSQLSEEVSICEPVDDLFYKDGANAFLNVCKYGPSTLNVFWPQGMATRRFPYYLYLYRLRLKETFGGLAMFVNMMLDLKRKKIAHVNVYGQGGPLDQVIGLAYHHGLTVDYVIDKGRSANARPWGSFRYASLSEASRASGNHVYVVASLTDVPLKQAEIEQAYKDRPYEPVIVAPSPEEPFF